MNVVIDIGGRAAIPVRAVPYSSGWTLAPDTLVDNLAEASKTRWLRDPRAYQLGEQNEANPIPPKEWDSYCSGIRALQEELNARYQGEAEQNSETRYQEWRQRSILVLPAAVFMWWDELEESFDRGYGRYSGWDIRDERSVDRELNRCPLVTSHSEQQILEGFERFLPASPTPPLEVAATDAGEQTTGKEPVPFAATISFFEASQKLKARLEANDFEIAHWIREGRIQAYSYGFGVECKEADPWRTDPDTGEPELYIDFRRYLREAVEQFDPSTPSRDDCEPADYRVFHIIGNMESVDGRDHGFNPSGRFVSFRQVLAFLGTLADQDDVVQRLRSEVRENYIMSFGLADFEPPLEDSYFYESQIVGLASTYYGRPLDGWDAVTRRGSPLAETQAPQGPGTCKKVDASARTAASSAVDPPVSEQKRERRAPVLAHSPERGARREPSRQDFLSIELDDILRNMAEEMERITATTVMPKLKGAAGSKASCITEDCAEGVLWCRVSNTQPEKLTMKALSKRIGRWKKRQQGR